HHGVGIQAVADLDLLGLADEFLDEGLIDLALDEHPGRRDADLTGIAEFAYGELLRGCVYIGVVENDSRRGAAKLHRDAFHMQTGQRSELFADGGRPGEDHLADPRM